MKIWVIWRHSWEKEILWGKEGTKRIVSFTINQAAQEEVEMIAPVKTIVSCFEFPKQKSKEKAWWNWGKMS